MKLTVLILFLFFLSCRKSKDDVVKPSNRVQIENIAEPLFFHDSLGAGELFVSDKILRIKKYSYGWDNYFYFDYYAGTKKLKSIFYKPASYPQSCVFSQCDFFYKNGKINKIEISIPTSRCEINIRTFQFEYFSIGALKSIVQETDLMISEIFFAYDSLGRVGKIYSSGRYKTEPVYRFNESTIKYNLVGNVSDVLFQPHYSNTVTDRISYQYDTVLNPFKGVYFPESFMSVFDLEESYAFLLSSNVIRSKTKFIASTSLLQTSNYIIRTNNFRLDQFYSSDQFGSTFYYQ